MRAWFCVYCNKRNVYENYEQAKMHTEICLKEWIKKREEEKQNAKTN